MINKREISRYMNMDYSQLVHAYDILIDSNGSQSSLEKVKNELNRIFNTKKCVEVLFTRNTDRMFFGMQLLPIIPNTKDAVLNDDKKSTKEIKEYAIEIDSKIISPILEFVGAHLTAITLHEIGHIMLDDANIDEFVDLMHVRLSAKRETLDKEKYLRSEGLFKFAAIDTMRKMHSFFYKNIDEIYADGFTQVCGFDFYLKDAFDKITKKSFKINADVKNKLMVLQWTLNNYKELELNRRYISKLLYNYGSLSGSRLDSRLATNTVKSLEDVSIYAIANDLVQEARGLGFMNKIKKDSIRVLENDMYELKIRIKSASDEGDVLFTLRAINNRLAIIEETLLGDNLTEDERDRWLSCQQAYLQLREELTSRKVSKMKMYGLFTDYSKLSNDYDIADVSNRY